LILVLLLVRLPIASGIGIVAISILDAASGWKGASTSKSALETALTIVILELIPIVSRRERAMKGICYLLRAGS
jgi:hydrogenase-4 membrane subunit HyfE